MVELLESYEITLKPTKKKKKKKISSSASTSIATPTTVSQVTESDKSGSASKGSSRALQLFACKSEKDREWENQVLNDKQKERQEKNITKKVKKVKKEKLFVEIDKEDDGSFEYPGEQLVLIEAQKDKKSKQRKGHNFFRSKNSTMDVKDKKNKSRGSVSISNNQNALDLGRTELVPANDIGDSNCLTSVVRAIDPTYKDNNIYNDDFVMSNREALQKVYAKNMKTKGNSTNKSSFYKCIDPTVADDGSDFAAKFINTDTAFYAVGDNNSLVEEQDDVPNTSHRCRPCRTKEEGMNNYKQQQQQLQQQKKDKKSFGKVMQSAVCRTIDPSYTEDEQQYQQQHQERGINNETGNNRMTNVFAATAVTGAAMSGAALYRQNENKNVKGKKQKISDRSLSSKSTAPPSALVINRMRNFDHGSVQRSEAYNNDKDYFSTTSSLTDGSAYFNKIFGMAEGEEKKEESDYKSKSVKIEPDDDDDSLISSLLELVGAKSTDNGMREKGKDEHDISNVNTSGKSNDLNKQKKSFNKLGLGGKQTKEVPKKVTRKNSLLGVLDRRKQHKKETTAEKQKQKENAGETKNQKETNDKDHKGKTTENSEQHDDASTALFNFFNLENEPSWFDGLYNVPKNDNNNDAPPRKVPYSSFQNLASEEERQRINNELGAIQDARDRQSNIRSSLNNTKRSNSIRRMNLGNLNRSSKRYYEKEEERRHNYNNYDRSYDDGRHYYLPPKQIQQRQNTSSARGNCSRAVFGMVDPTYDEEVGFTCN